jgi:hypothetical protein
MIELPVEIKTQYKHVYPMCEQGKLLCELAGKKTITKEMQPVLARLGYQLVDKTPRQDFNI